ncbi:hypothetical protein [Streptomyces sp. NPDC057794]|uniref:hypothetical protein n=1 Tax=Streptomyces sp. NPDC057794 TaxID=3346251 RepID=UPI003691A934
MKRTATVLSSLALSVALLGGTATASEADILPEVTHSKGQECKGHDSLGLFLLGIPLLGFFYPDEC